MVASPIYEQHIAERNDSFLISNIYPNMGATSATTTAMNQPEMTTASSGSFLDGFRRARNSASLSDDSSSVNGHVYNTRRAAANTAHSPLNRVLKGRHLQMIAIGGSIGEQLKFELLDRI